MSAAGGIIFNERGQLLIVKPTYHDDGWFIPRGVIEKKESPSQACIREINEEIGLDLIPDGLLCFEYHLPHGDEKKEAYKFLFHIGVLNQEQIDKIILQESELSEYRFIDYEETNGILIQYLYDRIGFTIRAMKDNRIIYLENMKEVYPHQ